MENKLVMLVGIPGSGKSTYAKELKKKNPEYVVHSSDDLRKELYGDMKIQDHNGELFQELHKRIIKDLELGKTVIYDATNLKKKRRIEFLKHIKCKKQCVLMITDYDTCLKNNSAREEGVPEKVIERMRKNFSPPDWSEGFDDIVLIRNKIKDYEELISQTKGFDQENEHHQYTLDEHLKKTAEAFSDEEYCLKAAAYFHDMGKLFTKSKLNYEGKEDGTTHYYNHQHVSAYEFLCVDPIAEEDLNSTIYISNLIYYHMHPYISWKQSTKAMNKDKRLIGDKMFNDILKLHEADKAAHSRRKTMKAINIGNTYDIYNDTVKVYDKLPAQNYIVRFSERSGFFLDTYSDIEIKEKIYGVHEKKVGKVLNTFKVIDKNLGVILSGDKGIGKSLFAKRLAVRAVEQGIPVVIVDKYIPGIASYIEEIEQEVMVLFDEFDKTFGGVKANSGETGPQDSLLSLFDGIAQGKKLFVITCNSLNKLNDFLVNRPGRFHYHFRFNYPSVEEIKEYLGDKLEKQYYSEIDKVISFSKKVDLNFDCLRAIAFELNSGERFEAAIQDLNIINLRDSEYMLRIHMEDGSTLHAKCLLDLFDKEREEEIWVSSDTDSCSAYVRFRIGDCKWNNDLGYTIPSENYSLKFDDYDEEESKKMKSIGSKYLTLTRCREKNIHYLV